MKQKLKLTLSELRALDLYLIRQITTYTLEYLKNWWQGYCVISSLAEIHAKVHAKVEDARRFPVRTDTIYRISLTRTQSVALACTTLEANDNQASLLMTEISALDYEQIVVRRIVDETVKQYLI